MKKILASIGFSVLVGLSGCASKNPQLETLDNVVLESQKPKQPEYKTNPGDSSFEIKRNNGDYFRCSHNECLLYLNDSRSELTNDRFRDKTAKYIVDNIHIPGFKIPSRRSIFIFDNQELEKYFEKKYEKADKIYRDEAINFKVDEVYTQWLARPDPLDKHLKKNSK